MMKRSNHYDDAWYTAHDRYHAEEFTVRDFRHYVRESDVEVFAGLSPEGMRAMMDATFCMDAATEVGHPMCIVFLPHIDDASPERVIVSSNFQQMGTRQLGFILGSLYAAPDDIRQSMLGTIAELLPMIRAKAHYETVEDSAPATVH